MPRMRVTISKEAQDSLMELQRRMHKPPSDVINELLEGQYKAIIDDELCKKEFFSSCIIYQLKMPFCFPHECESFQFHSNNREIRLYLERVPKRHIMGRLPFNTQATIIIELDNSDFPEDQNYSQIKNMAEKLAFNLLKKTIIYFRRITRDYYNFGAIKPPMTLEEFNRNAHVRIMKENQHLETTKRMTVKEGSEIVIKQRLDKNIINRTIDAVNLEEPDVVFSIPYDFFDQSIISYYDEEWGLCLVQGVIAMESALSRLVLQSKMSSEFSRIQKRSKKSLKDVYKGAPGLPQKIRKFLFPILSAKKLIESEEKLRELMPLIKNEKTERGIYDLRSKIVHEGLSVTEKEAKSTMDIVPKFFDILISILE